MEADERQDPKTTTSFRREAVTVAGSVLATLIATALISQFGTITAFLSSTFTTSIAATALFALLMVFLGGALAVVVARSGYQDRIRVLEARLEEVQRLAAIDIVTGAYNRNQIDRLISMRIEEAERKHETFSVIAIDIDGFKRINDTYGHDTGDKVLKDVASILDGTKGDLLIRYGGDEFIIISKLGIDKGSGFRFADRLREEVEDASFYAGFNRHAALTISCGVTEFANGDHGEDTIKRAIGAMERAKKPRHEDGEVKLKNWVYVHEESQPASE